MYKQFKNIYMEKKKITKAAAYISRLPQTFDYKDAIIKAPKKGVSSSSVVKEIQKQKAAGLLIEEVKGEIQKIKKEE